MAKHNTKLPPRGVRRNAARRRKFMWRELPRTQLSTGQIIVRLPPLKETQET